MNHDLIVVGASAGGLEALRRILPGLAADIPACVLVVVHVGSTSHLADILRHECALPVESATSGAPIQPGRVVIARPGAHLLVHDGHLLLRRGPRENMARPAVDPLFRTAAVSFGSRTIGVILSGSLSDGTAGLSAIKRCGGVTIVQDPRDVAADGMPLSALRQVRVDHVATAHDIAALLGRLAREPAGPEVPAPYDVRIEAAIATQEIQGMRDAPPIGEPSTFICPECHGPLWEVHDRSILRYRCNVGHAFNADVVLQAHAEEAERLLWTLLRTNLERADVAQRMSAVEQRAGRTRLAKQLAERADEYGQAAAVVRRMIDESASASIETTEAVEALEAPEGPSAMSSPAAVGTRRRP